MIDTRFFIKEWYDCMSQKRRKTIKDEYFKLFKANNSNAFYMALKAQNHTAEKLMFFADMFGCTINDLMVPPAEPIVRPQEIKLGQHKIKFDVLNA